jgi:hypothetical protein
VDRICEALFLSHRAQERDDNLLFVREYLLRAQVQQPQLLPIYAQVYNGQKVTDDLRDPCANALRLSGVAAAIKGQLRVRNRIYYRVFNRDWMQAQTPGGTRLEVRAAYRHGVARGVLTGLAAGVVLGLLLRMIFTTLSAPIALRPVLAPPAPTNAAPVLVFQQRAAQATANQLDLAKYYNHREFSELPNNGWLELVGGNFDARGSIWLAARYSRPYPDQVKVTVEQKARFIHVLHAVNCNWAHGMLVARYALEFENGQAWEMPVLFGKDLRHYREVLHKAKSAPPPAWSETNSQDQAVWRLYQMTITNPLPATTIRGLRLQSALSGASPVIVAITLEP